MLSRRLISLLFMTTSAAVAVATVANMTGLCPPRLDVVTLDGTLAQDGLHGQA